MSGNLLKKILVADDHSVFRDGIKSLFAEFGDNVEIIECGSCQQTLDVVDRHADLDLVLFDLRMHDMDGFEVLATIVRKRYTLPVIVISASEDADDMKRCLDVGAMGYIPKYETGDVMRSAIQLVLSGSIYTPAAMSASRNTRLAPELAGLTSRQMDVLQLMMEGCKNQDIASKLGITEVTIKTHVSAILKSLGVENRTQAVLKAKQLGL
ncbi:MAG: response regulator transcription factor [Gammaproteobacteria bacterium]|nr:response regulator transcription factor [Gammaproteobacteria bacterium]